jgi:hypothetical protein
MEENLLRFLSLLNICKFARKVTLGSNYLSKGKYILDESNSKEDDLGCGGAS